MFLTKCHLRWNCSSKPQATSHRPRQAELVSAATTACSRSVSLSSSGVTHPAGGVQDIKARAARRERDTDLFTTLYSFQSNSQKHVLGLGEMWRSRNKSYQHFPTGRDCKKPKYGYMRTSRRARPLDLANSQGPLTTTLGPHTERRPVTVQAS